MAKQRTYLRRKLLLPIAVAAGLVTGTALGCYTVRLNVIPRISIPSAPTVPIPNAYDYYSEAARPINGSEKEREKLQSWVLDVGNTPPPSLREMEEMVSTHGDSLKLLRLGLNFKFQNTASPVTVDRYGRKIILSPASERMDVSTLSNLLILDGRIKARRGDWAGACGSYLDDVQMGRSCIRGMGYWEVEQGMGCECEGLDALWDVINHLTAKQAQAAAVRLRTTQAAQMSIADVLQYEEWLTQTSFMEMFKDPRWRGIWDRDPWDEGNREPSDGSEPTGPDRTGASEINFISNRRFMADNTRFMDQMIANARLPYVSKPAPPKRPVDIAYRSKAFFDPENDVYMDTLARTQNALLLTALALRVYRLEHGGNPAALADLVPAYLPEMPADPFALHGPIRYRRTGKAYVLYSIGPDGKDDGGRSIDDPKAKPAVRYTVGRDSIGDIVAGISTIFP